jgi:hypothetical protein
MCVLSDVRCKIRDTKPAGREDMAVYKSIADNYTAPQPQPCNIAEDGVCEALEYYRSAEDYQPTPASEAIAALRERLGLRYEPTPNEGEQQ